MCIFLKGTAHWRALQCKWLGKEMWNDPPLWQLKNCVRVCTHVCLSAGSSVAQRYYAMLPGDRYQLCRVSVETLGRVGLWWEEHSVFCLAYTCTNAHKRAHTHTNTHKTMDFMRRIAAKELNACRTTHTTDNISNGSLHTWQHINIESDMNSVGT